MLDYFQNKGARESREIIFSPPHNSSGNGIVSVNLKASLSRAQAQFKITWLRTGGGVKSTTVGTGPSLWV